MKKGFNLMKAATPQTLANLRYGIPVHGNLRFGYENDDASAFDRAVDFALREDMYIAAFNHMTPFPRRLCTND